MKKILIVGCVLLLLFNFVGCSGSESAEETNAKSILNSAQAVDLADEEPLNVVVEKIELIKTQKAYNNEYCYYLVETRSNDWGFAELRNGEVNTFQVGYSKSDAKTRCKDYAEYRLSKAGSYGQ